METISTTKKNVMMWCANRKRPKGFFLFGQKKNEIHSYLQ